MKYLILFTLICVNYGFCVEGNEAQSNYVHLNLEQIGNSFTTEGFTNSDTIRISRDEAVKGKSIGKVSYGSTVLVEEPDSKGVFRYVRRVKVPTSGDYNPEIEEGALDGTQEPSQKLTTNFETLFEVHTSFETGVLVDRFKKNSDGEYKRFDYELVDVNICDTDYETVLFNNRKYIKVDNFKTVGAIKCYEHIMLDSLNVFYRRVRINFDTFSVYTVPRYGVTTSQTFEIHPSKQFLREKRPKMDRMSLDLGTAHVDASFLSSSCGNDCTFYDGCNEKVMLIDVIDNEKYVYLNRNTLCLSAKVEEVRDTKYVTIFDQQKNKDVLLVKIFKKEQNADRFEEHKKLTFDMDVSDFANPKPKEETMFKHMVETTPLGGNMRTRVVDIDFRIGKIFNGDVVLLDEGENVMNRILYSSADGVLVHDEHYDGQFKRYLLRMVEQKPAQEGEPATKVPKLSTEDPLAVDLHKVTTHVTKYLTNSENYLFIKSSSLAEKLGSLTFNKNMVYPNKFFVSRQYLILGDKDVKLHAITKKGFSFHESFVKTYSLKEDDTLFLCKAKDLLHLDVMNFYATIASSKTPHFNNFDVEDMGDYYYLGVGYKELFTALVGNVSASERVFAPLDMDLASRFVILPKHTQSFVVIKDCDFSDCWLKLYNQTSSHGKLVFELQEKEALELDLSKVYEHDTTPNSSMFQFDNFVVHKLGAYNVRVKNELTHKIGKVVYKTKELVADDPKVFTRMVNITLSKESGSLRVLDVERWDKKTQLFTYTVDNEEWEFTQKTKSDFVLDIEPVARNNTSLNIADRDGVMSYYLSWTNRDDFNLKKITYSEYETNSENLVTTTIRENLDNFPVFVRLHKDDEKNLEKFVKDGTPLPPTEDFVIVVENHSKLDKPDNKEFFKVQPNKEKQGFMLKYNIKSKKADQLGLFPKDVYHRRHYTAHRHEFDKAVTKETKSEEIPLD